MAENLQVSTRSNEGVGDDETAVLERSNDGGVTLQGKPSETLVVRDGSNVNIQWKPSINVTPEEQEIPENIKDQIEAELNQSSEVFQETSGFDSCLDVLRIYGSAVITADPGDGKTTLSCGIGRHLRVKGWDDGNVYTPVIIKNPYEWRRYVNPKKNQLVLIDDMFGSQNLSVNILNEWLTFLPNMEACIEQNAGTLLLIITSRKSILLHARDHLAKFKLFDLKKVVDLSLECNLTREDMRRITIIHKKRARVDLSEKQIDTIVQSGMRQGFPRTCDLIIRYGADPEKLEGRFKNPTDILINELQVLYNDPHQKALFMLCLFSDGELKVAEALESLSQNQLKIMEYAGLSPSATFVQLMKMQKSIPECYLKTEHKESRKFIRFSHPSVFFAVAQLLAKEHMEFLLSKCTFKLISDVVRLQSDDTRGATTTIGVDTEYEVNLAKRFIDEILEGNLQAVCSHSAFVSKDFIELFLTKAKQDGHHDILASTDSISHLPFLYWSVWNSRGTLCYTVLTTLYRNRSHKHLSDDIFVAIVGACTANNSQALASLLHLVTPEALVKCFDKKQALQRKACRCVEYYPSLLHIACTYGDVDTVLLVLTHQQEMVRTEHLMQILTNCVFSNEGDIFLLLIKNINFKTLCQVFKSWSFPKSFKHKIAEIVTFIAKSGAETTFKIGKRYEVRANGWQKKAKKREMKFLLTEDRHFMITIIPRSSVYDKKMQGYSPQNEMYEAAIANQIEIVDTLIQMGVDPNIESKGHGQTVLLSCCQLNKIEIVKCLLKHNTDVNLPNERTKQTPLYAACRAGHTQLASLLLDNGAKWTNQLEDVHECFRVACKRDNVDMVSLLVQGGASVNLVWSKDLETPLSIACSENHVELARILIALGSDVNADVGLEKETVLLRACTVGNTQHLVSALVKHGADVNRRSGPSSKSPLEQARETACEDIITCLLEHGGAE